MLSVLGAQPPSEGFGQTQKNVTIHEKHEIWSVFREFISKSPLEDPSFLVFRKKFEISKILFSLLEKKIISFI